MLKGEYVSSSDRCWTFDVLRRKIKLNHQGPLKMVLDFNIRSGFGKKWLNWFSFSFLVDIWFSEWAEGLKWRVLQKIIKTTHKIKQFSCFNIQQWNSLQPHGDSFFYYFSFNKRILSLAFNKVLLFIMFNGSPRNYTSITDDDTLRLMFLIPGSRIKNSSLKPYWEPSDKALFKYRGTQTVRAFKLLLSY